MVSGSENKRDNTSHGKNYGNLKGNPDRITMLDMQNLIVQTLENIYCFNMTVIEQRLNMSAQVVLEHQWALFVPEIVREAVQCRANILGVTVSELAELLRTDVSTLLDYTLDDITNIFFPNFVSLQARKNIFESRALFQAYALAGLTIDQGQAETMLFYAGHSTIAFNFHSPNLTIRVRWIDSTNLTIRVRWTDPTNLTIRRIFTAYPELTKHTKTYIPQSYHSPPMGRFDESNHSCPMDGSDESNHSCPMDRFDESNHSCPMDGSNESNHSSPLVYTRPVLISFPHYCRMNFTNRTDGVDWTVLENPRP